MGMQQPRTIDNLGQAIAQAVTDFWQTRHRQQVKGGRRDQASRGAVTGAARMNGVIHLFSDLLVEAGVDKRHIHFKTFLELPGFFRPTKEWDLLVVQDNKLLVALEAKSQVGPSFGNNFNNRTEEAIGSALDLWTAFREGALNGGVQPFLGYFFLLEDCPESTRPVSVREPHFKVLPEFKDASYTMRYELFCRKLVLERHYTAAAFVRSRRDTGMKGVYREPSSALTVDALVHAMIAQVTAHGV